MEAGDRIGPYTIVAPIAPGGMGVVYHARHSELGTEVAIKVLLPNLALNEKVRVRFRQEAYVQANLEHSNIVRVRDFLTHGKTLAIVMDRVRGPSLESILAKEPPGPWPMESVARVMLPVLDAVAFSHTKRVVHRDIKPGNVLLEQTPSAPWPGIAYVSDFGIAKLLEDGQGMTRTGARMGTLPYMSPEQFRGSKKIDTRSDVFSLAMLMWRLLTGRLPVDPQDGLAVAELYAGRLEVPPAGDEVEGVPEPLSTALNRAFRINPANRPANAGELASTVAPILMELSDDCASKRPLAASPARHNIIEPTSPYAQVHGGLEALGIDKPHIKRRPAPLPTAQVNRAQTALSKNRQFPTGRTGLTVETRAEAPRSPSPTQPIVFVAVVFGVSLLALILGALFSN
jgi:serine/threonine protein kinase